MTRVLVIDDEEPIRSNVVRFLRLEGLDAMQAQDGEAGLAVARAQRPDLILCDVMMPRMNGLEVLALVQADPQLRTVPFFFLSASAEPEKLEQAMTLGARGYLTKPFNLAQLREVLKQNLPSWPPATPGP